MLFNLKFANDTILLCFFFFFLIIDLNFLNAAVIVQSSNPIAKLVTRTGISTKEAKIEMELHAVTVEPKIRKSSI